MTHPEAAVLAWMRDFPDERNDERFLRIAQDLFAHQFEHCDPYRRFCESRGKTPELIRDWTEIPPVPTGAFKEIRLASFPEERQRHVFRTSGTATQRRGEIHLENLDAYEASLVPSFEQGLLPDLPNGSPVRMLSMVPSPEETPESSLSHMLGVMHDRRGDPPSRFLVEDGKLQLDEILNSLSTTADDSSPLLLCGTAFAFVHLLEGMESIGRRVDLPPNARIMETGGFKGRARAMKRDALYAWITDRLSVPSARIVNQYGMTELASQFYDTVMSRPGEPRRKRVPPWVRIQIVEPETGREVIAGQVGVIRIVDLANTGSILAIQTADLGLAKGDGFEVLGRARGAEARGCSIAADEMLSAARS